MCLHFRYDDLDYASGLYYYASLTMIPVYITIMLLLWTLLSQNTHLVISWNILSLMKWASSYSPIFIKNNSVNTIAQSNIPMNALLFWCGWETKSLHNIFSYNFTSLFNYMRYGNTLAHWFFKKSNEIYVGVPPTLDYIRHNLIWWICL